MEITLSLWTSTSTVCPFPLFPFVAGFIVVPNSNWQYTDAPQSDDAWKAADYDASSWAAASSFPSLTATRYYRYVVDLPVSNTTVNAIEIGTIVNSGYVLYINGQEVTRQYMPTYAPLRSCHSLVERSPAAPPL